MLAGLVICGRCRATLETYADRCNPSLGPCEGFQCVERLKALNGTAAVSYAQARVGEAIAAHHEARDKAEADDWTRAAAALAVVVEPKTPRVPEGEA